eukprot:CAMPEP_0118895188 /NCGR_PEP_ID=MMETSP1166-20130328/3650_1 /TAXON_ID=1104430 /ORGANISM="Chrysoreinhardia sp, Strain CCMP3193" /LENGTH=162 /DNA_ID=CAMNT_0006834187 /DNA_START=33 /DNA_END=518 /DNA_ORIENTATION=-
MTDEIAKAQAAKPEEITLCVRAVARSPTNGTASTRSSRDRSPAPRSTCVQERPHLSTPRSQEDDLALVFKDISPTAPVHYVAIPKNRSGMTQLSKVGPSFLPSNGLFLREKRTKRQKISLCTNERTTVRRLTQATEDNKALLGHLMFVVGKVGRETTELADG